MRRILKLSTIALLLTFSFSCEKENSELKENNVGCDFVKNSINNESRTTCIVGPTFSNEIADLSEDIIYVNPGSTEIFSYANDTGTPSSIIWTMENVNPPNSMTINLPTGISAENVTVTFSSDFINGELRAVGTGNGALDCSASVNICGGRE